MSADEVPQFLSVKEVSERLRVSRGCIYELVEKGRLEHVRIGCGRGTIRIPLAAVQEYLAHGSVKEGLVGPSPTRGRSTKRAFAHLDPERLTAAWKE